jgi:chemotaxis protein methyltransferase CheR
VLRTYPTVRLWIPGCGRGADAFSLAVLLSEEGLLSRVRIYATDFDQKTIEEAAEGRVTAARFKQSLENFTAAGGTGDLHRFFTRVEDGFRLKPAIRKTVFFTVHSLMTDRSFNEFHAIVARDVLSAFQSPLLERAFNIFHESLGRFGFLGLGDEESLSKNPNRRCYEPLLDGGALWWRKVADQ